MNLDNSKSIESKKQPEAKSCAELSLEFEKRQKRKETKQQGVILKFLGIKPSKDVGKITAPVAIEEEMVIAADVKDKERDVYNPTPPILIDGEMIMAARVEDRGDENSEVHFFKQDEQDEFTWIKIENTRVLPMQDPFITIMKSGEIIVGGVEASPILSGSGEDSNYRTVFYKGKSLDTLEKFAIGPEKMKDIRIIELPNGHIGVFTRPQDGIYGPGQIAYIELDGLIDLNPENIAKAKVIEGLFVPGEWGGAGQLHWIKEGEKIGVIGHIACFDEEFNKIYHAMSFVFDPKTHTVSSPLKIIATRDNFPESEPKKPKLKKVFLTGGIDTEFNLYGGLGDAGAGMLSLFEHPF